MERGSLDPIHVSASSLVVNPRRASSWSRRRRKQRQIITVSPTAIRFDWIQFAQDVASKHGTSQSESYRGIGEAGAVHHPDAARYTNTQPSDPT